MKIDFKNIEEKIVPNFKGGEGRYIMKQFADEKVKIMYVKLEPGWLQAELSPSRRILYTSLAMRVFSPMV